MKAKKLNLSVQYAMRYARVPSRPQIRKWALAALRRPAEITFRIVGKAEGRMLNRDFRGKDYATDVLTFAYPGTKQLSGDIALCAPVVVRAASERGKNLKAHYAHLVVHGVLHLQGYSHERKTEAEEMERLEAQIITGLGFPDPYEREAYGVRGKE
ncbi:MAG TPA: rRNA maturation RNase YbeY [Burkholderiales bacterium]|nr:rRNA maturation RNase YbeY [Burkholderiales bacterium]